MTAVSLMVSGLQWLSADTFEVRFQRPPDIVFVPGQKIRFGHQDIHREYTLLNASDDDELAICVRHIPYGRFSPVLAGAKDGDYFQASPPFGYFVYQPSSLPAVFVATGTGVAPFVAFARNGVRGFRLLHGVCTATELYYQDNLRKSAATYTPCLSGGKSSELLSCHGFVGRVTNYALRSSITSLINPANWCCSRGLMA